MGGGGGGGTWTGKKSFELIVHFQTSFLISPKTKW